MNVIARFGEYGAHDFASGAHDLDARLIAFLERALLRGNDGGDRECAMRALESDVGAKTSLCAILIAAFVSVAHSERAVMILGGMTFGRGFVHDDDAWLKMDERKARKRAGKEEEEGWTEDDGVLMMAARAYESSKYFTEQMFYLLARSKYERNSWFERIFTSLWHYLREVSATTVKLKENAAEASLDDERGDGHAEELMDGFLRSSVYLYAHLRLLETSIVYMGDTLLEDDAKYLTLLAELVDYMCRDKICDNQLVFVPSLHGHKECLNPEFSQALRFALFGVFTANQNIQRELCRKMQKMSSGVPDFSSLLDVNLDDEEMVKRSGDKAGGRRSEHEHPVVYGARGDKSMFASFKENQRRRIREAIERGIRVISETPKEEDFSESAPEEFLDSITGQLMNNPVKLKSSNQYVDASTIARLKDNGAKTDPFTGKAIDYDACEVDANTKQRLDEWRSSVAKTEQKKRKRVDKKK